MEQYIKAKNLVDLIVGRIENNTNLGLTERVGAYEDVLDMIRYSSPIDVEEVTRCKDCHEVEDLDGTLYCWYFNKNVYADDFCSNGG